MTNTKEKITAGIWDFDGTLVDTFLKNFNVARRLIEKVTGKKAETFPIFRSLETYNLANRSYKNWREMYKSEYNFSERETDRAGSLWTEYQLKDDTSIEIYPGLAQVIKLLKVFPQGIVSMNSRNHIRETLKANDLSDLFQFIVGYAEVDMQKQKPEPDGLLMCVEKLTALTSGIVFYIGDHETDVRCAANANNILNQNHVGVKIITIAVTYGANDNGRHWNVNPDYVAARPKEIIDIIQNFPA